MVIPFDHFHVTIGHFAGGKLDAEAKVYLTFPDNQVLFSFGKAAESNGKKVTLYIYKPVSKTFLKIKTWIMECGEWQTFFSRSVGSSGYSHTFV